MGYTHYWRIHKPFSNDAWVAFTKDVANVFANTKIPLANAYGNQDTQPLIGETGIEFNGVEEDSHESCSITRYASGFSFCKTAYKPYDAVVVEVLKLARKHNPSIELSSDGDNVFD